MTGDDQQENWRTIITIIVCVFLCGTFLCGTIALLHGQSMYEKGHAAGYAEGHARGLIDERMPSFTEGFNKGREFEQYNWTLAWIPNHFGFEMSSLCKKGVPDSCRWLLGGIGPGTELTK